MSDKGKDFAILYQLTLIYNFYINTNLQLTQKQIRARCFSKTDSIAMLLHYKC